MFVIHVYYLIQRKCCCCPLLHYCKLNFVFPLFSEQLSKAGPSQLVLCFAGGFFMFQSMGILLQKYLNLNMANQFTVRQHPAGRSLMAFNNLQHVEIFHVSI